MNFEDYLLQGKILDALRYRVQVLQRTAEKERSNCDAARLVSLGAIAISLPFVAPLPGVGVMAGIAGVSYLGTVWRDFQTSGKLCLLPGSRIGAGDILSIFGLAGEEVSPREQQLTKVMDFLPYEQRIEYAVLVDDEPQVADLLKRLPAQDRLAGYSYMVRRMALGDVKAMDVVEVKAAIAVEAVEPAAATQIEEPTAILPAIESSSLEPDRASRYAVSSPLPENIQSVADARSPIDHLIEDRLRTTLITAVSGGGKDYLMANAVREFLSRYPYFRVIVMDCKNDPKEYGYFAGLTNVQVTRLAIAETANDELIDWVEDALDTFNDSIPECVLLVCNEGTDLRFKLKQAGYNRYVGIVNSTASSGDSRQKYVWEAGQSAHLVALQVDSSARSRMRHLIIGMKGEELQIEAIMRAQFISKTALDMQVMKRMISRSEVNRSWCDGYKWYPMPKLENHCGYDRDSRSYTTKPNHYREELKTINSFERSLAKAASGNDEYHPEQFTLNATKEDFESLLSFFDQTDNCSVDRSLFPVGEDQKVWSHYQWWLSKNPGCGKNKYIETVWNKKAGKGQEKYRDYLNFLEESQG